MAEPSSAAYPSTTPNLNSNIANQKSYTVSGTVLVGAATVPVVETIAITAPQYLVNTTTGEIIYSESISGTNFLSVTRGADGTTATQMESGQKLRPVYAANLYNQMVREIKAIAAEVDTKQDSFGYGSGLILSGTDALVDIDTGAGLTFSTADKLAVSLDTTKGLDFSSGKIGINADTDAGLKHSTGGKLQVSVTSGIGFSSGALRAISSDIDHDALTNFLSSEHVPVIDEDTMASNSTGFVPTQQSVKAYIDTKVASYEPDVTWGDGLSNSSGTASVDADTTKGLDFSSGKLQTVVDTSKGIDYASGKIAASIDTSRGLDFISSGKMGVLTDTAKGIDFTSSGRVGLVIDTTRGLDFSSGKAYTPIDTTRGLDYSSGRIYTAIDTTKGLDFSSGKIQGIVDTSKGIDFVSGKFAAVVDTSRGVDFISSGKIGVLADTSKGIDFISSGKIGVVVDTSKGLDFSSGQLGVSIDTTRGMDFSSGKLAVRAASSTGSGRVELATITETSSGTDAARAVTPDGLSGSIFGTKRIILPVVSPTDALTTGDGKAYITLPAELNGMNLVDADACVYTASTNGTPTIQIHNLTDSHDLLTTRITIDATEKTSYTALTQPVIASSYDDVATADILRVDVDGKGSTATKGLEVHLAFRLP